MMGEKKDANGKGTVAFVAGSGQMLEMAPLLEDESSRGAGSRSAVQQRPVPETLLDHVEPPRTAGVCAAARGEFMRPPDPLPPEVGGRFPSGSW